MYVDLTGLFRCMPDCVSICISLYVKKWLVIYLFIFFLLNCTQLTTNQSVSRMKS